MKELKVKSSKCKVMEFKNKKVLVMGLGLHGGGVSVVNWLIKQGTQVRVTDLKIKKELLPSLREIISKKVSYTFGRHLKKDFLWADMVIQNPGVPRDSWYLAYARKHGAEIENEATLFFKIIGRERIIGVTGTRGKSTTATLIFQFLKKKFPDVLLGGNIASVPMFSIIDKAQKGNEPIVLELSSWHLENLGEKKLSPHIAVVTNLMTDHLNRYKSLKDYYLAKVNIVKYQDHNDFVILNKDDTNVIKFFRRIPSKKLFFPIKHKVYTSNLKGWHNQQNIAAAILVAKIFGVSQFQIQKVLKSFSGLPHRLEVVCRYKAVSYINDTSATTPDATRAALNTLSQSSKLKAQSSKHIILIAGGSDKGIPQKKFNDLAKKIKMCCKAVILFTGQGSKKIYRSLKVTSYKLQVTRNVKRMSDALRIARNFAQQGDIILLSPACASFGLFQHEFDRGDQFKKCIQQDL